ncbi:MAG: hypothetical protein LBK95_11750 [Bifidobacteriaceae bacterium]|jgi:hypothetical protein|nr:hypothetical protein [Bifidobacteriaceae bacterium]
MKVAQSARKHGVRSDDALLAAQCFITAYRLGDDPIRELRLGFDSEARLLETVVLINEEGTGIVIHAMRARAAMLDLLPRKEKQ